MVCRHPTKHRFTASNEATFHRNLGRIQTGCANSFAREGRVGGRSESAQSASDANCVPTKSWAVIDGQIQS